MNKAAEAIALFDLDGTLADFDKEMLVGLLSLSNPEEKRELIKNLLIADYDQDNEPVHMKTRRRLIKKVPGFWENLEQFKLGFDVLNEVKKLNYDLMVLSKGPRANSNAWAEKIRWCEKNLHNYDYKITLTEDKGLVYGKVLVDDWVPYVERWLEWRTRGLVIMPAHKRNENYKHPNVVRYDGTNLQEVIDRLEKQRATCDNA